MLFGLADDINQVGIRLRQGIQGDADILHATKADEPMAQQILLDDEKRNALIHFAPV